MKQGTDQALRIKKKKARDLVFRALGLLILITVMPWGTNPEQRANAFRIFMAAALFALTGWELFFHARRICAKKSIFAKRYYPQLLQRIWSPASFRTRGSRLEFQLGGVVLFFVSAFLLCVAIRSALSP